MGSGSTSGSPELCTLGSFIKDSNRGEEDGRKMQMIFILTLTRGIITRTRKTGLECLHGLVVISTKDTTRMMKGRDLERCDGQTEAFTKENGSEEFSMERVK